MSKVTSFDRIFLSYRGVLTKIVSRLVPPHDVEDVVQETYVRVCRLKQKDSVIQPHALMTTIARNVAIDYIKRAGQRLNTSIEDVEETQYSVSLIDDPMHLTEVDEEFTRFCKMVRTLPQQCRRAFVLKKVYGFSQREIAAQMKISENTVENHIVKGLKICIQYRLQQRNNEKNITKGVGLSMDSKETRT